MIDAVLEIAVSKAKLRMDLITDKQHNKNIKRLSDKYYKYDKIGV